MSKLTVKYLAALLILLLALSSAARNWQSSNGVRWGNDCQFPGNELQARPATNLTGCISLCQTNPLCTHFTHVNNWCHMKRSEDHMKDVDKKEAFCGFIANRTKQNFWNYWKLIMMLPYSTVHVYSTSVPQYIYCLLNIGNSSSLRHYLRCGNKRTWKGNIIIKE